MKKILIFILICFSLLGIRVYAEDYSNNIALGDKNEIAIPYDVFKEFLKYDKSFEANYEFNTTFIDLNNQRKNIVYKRKIYFKPGMLRVDIDPVKGALFIIKNDEAFFVLTDEKKALKVSCGLLSKKFQEKGYTPDYIENDLGKQSINGSASRVKEYISKKEEYKTIIYELVDKNIFRKIITKQRGMEATLEIKDVVNKDMPDILFSLPEDCEIKEFSLVD